MSGSRWRKGGRVLAWRCGRLSQDTPEGRTAGPQWTWRCRSPAWWPWCARPSPLTQLWRISGWRDRTLDLANPGEPGGEAVRTLTYGSGKDIRRPEYGEAVDLVSRSVDGSKLIDNWDGPGGWLRTRYWGFDVTELPLQGRVWYPHGSGPFPLVLIVHGNHGMEDFSDPGYAHLGELLASRGYIFVSVDENFLNSSWGWPLDTRPIMDPEE